MFGGCNRFAVTTDKNAGKNFNSRTNEVHVIELYFSISNYFVFQKEKLKVVLIIVKLKSD